MTLNSLEKRMLIYVLDCLDGGADADALPPLVIKVILLARFTYIDIFLFITSPLTY